MELRRSVGHAAQVEWKQQRQRQLVQITQIPALADMGSNLLSCSDSSMARWRSMVVGLQDFKVVQVQIVQKLQVENFQVGV